MDRLKIVQEKLKQIQTENDGLRLWLRLEVCTQMVQGEIRAILREKFQMTLPRFDVLSALAREPDGLPMGELSQWLMVSKGNLTGIAERLSEDGYIKRQPTLTDRRSYVITLTKSGANLYAKMAKEYETCVEEVFAEISPEEIDVFMGVLGRVKESVEDKAQQREFESLD